MVIRTLGRRPTLGEVLEYYTRDDFLRFLPEMLRIHRVVMVIPERGHWAPNWKENEVGAEDVGRLGQRILDGALENWPEASMDDPLSYYPSFHQSVGRWPDGEGNNSKPRQPDCIFEADLPTWRESFRDVVAIIDLMDRYGICYRHKFSGHRSLHVLIPSEGFPAAGRGRAAQQLAGRLTDWSGSRAHRLPKIMRMPYSLNEDTGLVSLPIERGALSEFRVWQANLHLVDVRDNWMEEVTENDQANMEAFLDALISFETEGKERSMGPAKAVPFLPDREKTISHYRERLNGFQATDEMEHVRRLLVSDNEMPEPLLMEGLAYSDPEAQWLAVEAFLLHGKTLSKEGFLELLKQEDEYVRPAALDVILRFSDVVQEYVVEEMQAEDMGRQARILYVLGQGDRLRHKVMSTLQSLSERSGALTLRLACMMGVGGQDWPAAWAIVRGAEAQHGKEPTWATRIQALRMMEDITHQWAQKALTERGLALAALGPENLDLLLLAVVTPERLWRRAFLVALSELGDERAMDVFIGALGDKFKDSVKWGTRGLMKLGARAVPALLEAAVSDQTRLRRYAIRCLGHLGDPRARETIVAALEDTDEGVCRQAIAAARHFATETEIDRLKQVVRSRERRTAQAAFELLVTLSEAGRRAAMALALEEGEPMAAQWLWQQGDERGRRILLSALDGPSDKREAAILLLAEDPDEGLVDVFIRCLSTFRPWERVAVIEALVRLRHQKGLDALIALSRSENRMDRKQAAEALGKWDDPRAIEALVERLDDEHSKVRAKVADGLFNLGEAARAQLGAAEASHPSRRTRHSTRMLLQGLDMKQRLSIAEGLDEALLDQVAHSSIQVRQFASEWVRKRDSDRDINVLVSALGHSDRLTRDCAGHLLIRIGARARDAVVALLKRETGKSERKTAEWAEWVLEKLPLERE